MTEATANRSTPATLGDPANTIAARILRVLTSSRYRKGSLRELNFPGFGASLFSLVHQRVCEGTPVQLSLMAFPFKVPNPAKVGARSLPDLAELGAIRYLLTLAREIEQVYPAGIRFEIIHDGALIADVFGVELEEVRAYERYFLALVGRESGGATIRCHDFESLQQSAGLDPNGILDRLHAEAVHWVQSARGTPAWTDCFRKTLGMLDLRDQDPEVAGRLLDAARDGVLPPEFRELESRITRAMTGYQVKDAIIHQCDPRETAFPGAIHATTRPRANRLALWLVRRGNALLPWHGVGVSGRNGAVRVALARDTIPRPHFTPILLEGEDTPFGYASSAS